MNATQLKARHAEDQAQASLAADLATISNDDLTLCCARIAKFGSIEAVSVMPSIIVGSIVSAVLTKEFLRRKAEGEL
jgi:hypothetical protein